MLEFILSLSEDFQLYLQNGGLIMWPLMLATGVLWFCLGYRMIILRRGSDLPLRSLIYQYSQEPDREVTGFVDAAVEAAWRTHHKFTGDISGYLEAAFFPLDEGLGRYRHLVRTIVLLAPLAGLLGTVTGMIEMFDSLGNQTFYSQTGGIANGISQALFTTQFGLAVAVPGMIIGTLLELKENRMRNELFQIKEFFTSSQLEQGAAV